MKSNAIFKQKITTNRSGYAQVIGGIVALLLTIIIGVMVYWQISGAIPLTNDAANTSRNSTNTMATTVFNLLPIVALIVVAGVILAIVLGFGGSGKKS